MQLKVINKTFSVCKVEDYSQIDLTADFVFIGKTDEELSLVCETLLAPSNTIEREDGWRAFRIVFFYAGSKMLNFAPDSYRYC